MSSLTEKLELEKIFKECLKICFSSSFKIEEKQKIFQDTIITLMQLNEYSINDYKELLNFFSIVENTLDLEVLLEEQIFNQYCYFKEKIIKNIIHYLYIESDIKDECGKHLFYPITIHEFPTITDNYIIIYVDMNGRIKIENRCMRMNYGDETLINNEKVIRREKILENIEEE